MSRPILATKLYIPQPRPRAVSRPRLLEKLNEGLNRKLTLISAPAGFGKTTLVSEWVADSKLKPAWLSLDKEDSEPPRFLLHLIAALQKVDATIGKALLRDLESPRVSLSNEKLESLLNEITASSNVVLILDDYHLVDAKPVDDALTFLLEHQPPNLHLVITTREDPQLPLSRLRVRDQLTELRAADLRFTPAEAAHFLNEGMGLNLSNEDIARLDTRTEGWIAGLQLAALAVQGRKDTATFIGAFTGSHDFVVDYLLEEVLQQQLEQVQTFLLQTSILDSLSGPLCDVVTGQEHSGEMLETLRRGSLFVIPLDDKREWYRYHHLFADVLQARLAKTHAHEVAELHVRASEWYEGHEIPADAIRHALAAEDFERAARLLEFNWRKMDVTFQSATWLEWVKALPETLIPARPVLSVGYGWTLLNTGQFEAMEAKLHDAERHLTESQLESIIYAEDEFARLPATIASARAYKAQALGDVAGTIQHASRALEHLSEDDLHGRAIPNALLGLAHWSSGNLDAAFDTLAAGLAGFKATGNVMAAISGVFGLADIRVAQGRLREAVRLYEEALTYVAEQGDPHLLGTETLHVGLSELHREQGNVEAAEHYLLKSEEQSKGVVQTVFPYLLSLARARAQASQGAFDAALTHMDEAAQHQTQLHIPVIRPVAARKAKIWLKQGNVSDAQRWAREQHLTSKDELSYLREFDHLTFARLLIALASVDEAIGLLVRLLKAAETGGRVGSVIEILIVQALAFRAKGEETAALESFERALTFAEPEDYVLTFIDEGEGMLELLTMKAQVEPYGYVNKLLSFFKEGTSANTDSPSPEHLNDLLIEPLSERELEVLRLLAQGLSNRDIGKRLFRALDTVKGYNRTIFSKLQVKNRTEAVTKARELDLLQ